VVSAGKLRKLWDFLSELRRSLCEGRLERTVNNNNIVIIMIIIIIYLLQLGCHLVAVVILHVNKT